MSRICYWKLTLYFIPCPSYLPTAFEPYRRCLPFWSDIDLCFNHLPNEGFLYIPGQKGGKQFQRFSPTGEEKVALLKYVFTGLSFLFFLSFFSELPNGFSLWWCFKSDKNVSIRNLHMCPFFRYINKPILWLANNDFILLWQNHFGLIQWNLYFIE